MTTDWIIDLPVAPLLITAVGAQVAAALAISIIDTRTLSGRFLAVAVTTLLLNAALHLYLQHGKPSLKPTEKVLVTRTHQQEACLA